MEARHKFFTSTIWHYSTSKWECMWQIFFMNPRLFFFTFQLCSEISEFRIETYISHTVRSFLTVSVHTLSNKVNIMFHFPYVLKQLFDYFLENYFSEETPESTHLNEEPATSPCLSYLNGKSAWTRAVITVRVFGIARGLTRPGWPSANNMTVTWSVTS